MVSRALLAGGLCAVLVATAPLSLLAADPPRWLGDDLPLPLNVKTPADIGFKAAAERQYLIFNLMAGGKLAYQRGDYAAAVEKWETLLRIAGLDPQIEKAVMPFLTDARAKAGHGGNGAHVETRPEPVELPPPDVTTEPARATKEPRAHAAQSTAHRASSASQTTVS